MNRFIKNACQYTNFLHFPNCFNNWRNFGLHWNILHFQTCSNLSTNFFTQNGVVAKPFETVLWNFAWKNRRSCAFKWYKTKFLHINALRAIKVSFVAVVIDGRVEQMLDSGSWREMIFDQRYDWESERPDLGAYLGLERPDLASEKPERHGLGFQLRTMVWGLG